MGSSVMFERWEGRNSVSNRSFTTLQLDFGMEFTDLYSPEGLERLDQIFLGQLQTSDAELHAAFCAARAAPERLAGAPESALLLRLAPELETFIGQLFGISPHIAQLARQHTDLAPLYRCKRLFVQRRATKTFTETEAARWDGNDLCRRLASFIGKEAWSELDFAQSVMNWLEDEPSYTGELDLALRYAAWAHHTIEGQKRHSGGVLFKSPKKLDVDNLVPLVEEPHNGLFTLKLAHPHGRQREGFDLTDHGADLLHALDQAHYCIFCHNQGKDSCSKGLKEKTGGYRKSPFGISLAGCPLEEKISEFHSLKSEGVPIGALAMITVDNPMAAATGHRICNDCMKSCIYQKQEPVNIPEAETRTLKDVLELPWGFEIYSLLTRWNPLNLRHPYARKESGRKVLIAGLGPAGFTLAHYLLNDGHCVVAIDGLKIEPLPSALSGIGPDGRPAPFEPIYDIHSLYERLDERVMAGFGGVAEYGITVRWDKNFLKIIRLLLERRRNFAMFGGVRFGGTVTAEQAFAMGFDHVALALGAGRPTVLSLPGSYVAGGLLPGVRMASDFLMALQLTGAAKKASLANLQLRMPVLVVGGGLTAIDTATEALAYYPVQVEKFLSRYEILCQEQGEARVRSRWTAAEAKIADEFLTHARAIREVRKKAAEKSHPVDLRPLLDEWGGVTIAYRRQLTNAPSYTLNHEEVEKALEEGIRFAENQTPISVAADEDGQLGKVTLQDAHGAMREVPARALLVAAGTSPNTVLAREFPEIFLTDGRYFRAIDETGAVVTPERIAKPNDVQMLHHIDEDGRGISFFGDLHPSFAGNVVKAMGSAKQGWPSISKLLHKRPAIGLAISAFLEEMRKSFLARIVEINRLTPTIMEVVVAAPLAARNFEPGEFYRLQNYESIAGHVDGTSMAMEGLALTGAWVDKEKGWIGAIVLEMGGSSDLCALLQPGEPVVLMGPTGTPTEIPTGETVLLAGGGLGNAVLFSIGRALRANGCRTLYFAGYKKLQDRYKVADIESAADIVVWASDEAPGFAPTRPQDLSFTGNIIDAMLAYQEGRLGTKPIDLTEIDRIIAIGSDGMMRAIAAARHQALKSWLKPCHRAIGSINSPMQCMMKEICGQCLQPHIDPASGVESVVFSCFNQDQELDRVDFSALRARLNQNAVQEKLTAQWIARCLARRHSVAAAPILKSRDLFAPT